MKRFIVKLALLPTLIFILPLILLFTVCPQYTHEYTASFIDKIHRLESIKEPKIVLVSNSNLAFGIQSDLIEREIGMPVVNLGLHGGLGNAFHERMPLFNLTEGDIILVAHLSYNDDDVISDSELALLTVENYFRFWKIFRAKDFPRIICTVPKYTYKCLFRFIRHADKEPASPTCYARSAFNEYGDNIFPRNEEAGESKPELRHPSVNTICMKRINAFYKFCKAKGISVVIAGAPIIDGLPDFNMEEYRQFQNDVETLAECPVISDFTDYVFNKKYFYAGALHMTNEGAHLRTEQLITDLKAFLESQN